MNYRALCMAAGLMTIQLAHATELPELPKQLPPLFGTAVVVKHPTDPNETHWQVRLTFPKTQWEVIGKVVPKQTWPEVRTDVKKTSIVLSFGGPSALAESQIVNRSGKSLERNEVESRLSEETPVLISVSGKMLDDYYLQLFKPDSIVVILGPRDGAPAPQLLPVQNPEARPDAWAQPIELEGVPNLYQVSEGLYRSAQPNAAGLKHLKSLGIVTVVNLRSFHSDREEIGNTGLGYEHLYMKAWHPERKEAVRFLKIMANEKARPVLVHCQHGADRTGSMVALYRIVVQGWTKEEAIREMTNGGFGFHEVWTNLPDWIKELDAAELRREAGIKEEVEE